MQELGEFKDKRLNVIANTNERYVSSKINRFFPISFNIVGHISEES
jgi:hypothetical protein